MVSSSKSIKLSVWWSVFAGIRKLPKLAIPAQLARSEFRGSSTPRPPRQISRRLARRAVAQLITDDQAGSTTRDLASRYTLSKTPVTRLLREHGLGLRHQGLSDEQVASAAALYSAGRSVAQVASIVGVHPRAVTTP